MAARKSAPAPSPAAKSVKVKAATAAERRTLTGIRERAAARLSAAGLGASRPAVMRDIAIMQETVITALAQSRSLVSDAHLKIKALQKRCADLESRCDTIETIIDPEADPDEA
jgi:hypothetical protein